MARATLDPVFELFTGKIGNLIFRRAHTGKITVMYHRARRILSGALSRRHTAARSVYEQMAAEKKSNKRPFDMAVSDCFAGNNLLQK